MRGRSLRLRLAVAGTIAILAALGIAGSGLVVLFQRHVARTLASDLDVHLRQLLDGLEVGADGRIAVARPPADPRFAEPLSGLYWQVSDDHGQLLRSRSLWDTTLNLPIDEPGPSEVHQHEIGGPGGTRILVAERSVVMNPDQRIRVRAAVASDLVRATIAVRAFAKDLSIALGVLALVLALAMSLQVSLGLRPLTDLRRQIAQIRAGQREGLPAAVPTEVAPLAEELNALLDAQRREIVRSRGRAADLAHGFKTPLAALVADAARLRERGEVQLAHNIDGVAEAMSRQVDRELARARLHGGVHRAAAVETELAPLISALVATLARTSSAARIHFETAVPDRLRLPFDRVDLAEVLGNLLENAARHARSRVRVAASAAPPGVVIEDDGAGIAKDQIARVLERGARLDEQAPGSGLGLAIVQDVLDAYGWRLQIDRSDLGGARVAIASDRAGSPPAAEQSGAPEERHPS